MSFEPGDWNFDSRIGDYAMAEEPSTDFELPSASRIESGTEIYSISRTRVFSKSEGVYTVSKGLGDFIDNVLLLDDLGIDFPSTVYASRRQADRFFDAEGEDFVTINYQPKADTEQVFQSFPHWFKKIRRFGEMAGAEGYALDLKPSNFGIVEDSLVYHDLPDASSVMERDPWNTMATHLAYGFYDILKRDINPEPAENLIDDWDSSGDAKKIIQKDKEEV